MTPARFVNVISRGVARCMAAALILTTPSLWAAAEVIAVATPPDFAESRVPNPKTEWPCVGSFRVGFGGLCSGALISPRHVLTAAHCFFPGSDGMGQMLPILPEFRLSQFDDPFKAAKVTLAPGYNPMLGHRKGGNDLAIITLDRDVPINPALLCTINCGQIPDERNPNNETIKIGFGRSGNGQTGSVGASGVKRFMRNRVDQFGDGRTTWHKPMPNDPSIRNDPPPVNTLVYDFDDPNVQNSSDLKNFFDEKQVGAVGPDEGSPASGDSGGPMFQRLDAMSPWILVGITSSGSDSRSRFGSVAYDTRVRSYKDFIKATAVPEPGALAAALALACAAARGFAHRRRARQMPA